MNTPHCADYIDPLLHRVKDEIETVLVVDGDEAVLETAVAILEDAHFRVLHANCGADALKLAGEIGGEIHVLLTDVDVPDMSGPELGQMLKKARPGIHIMLMSEAEHGNLLVLNYGWAYIQKLLVPIKLVQMVREVIDSPDRSQPGGQEFECPRDAGPNKIGESGQLVSVRKVKSNCIVFALKCWFESGGFIVLRKSNYGWWPHVFWTKDLATFHEFTPAIHEHNLLFPPLFFWGFVNTTGIKQQMANSRKR